RRGAAPGRGGAGSVAMTYPSKLLKFAAFRWDGVPIRQYKTADAPYRGVTRQTLLGEGAGEEAFNLLTRYLEADPGASSTHELHRRIARADAAARDWRGVPVAGRAERLRAAGRILRERKDAYARTMALEMGKPLAQGVAEAEKCAWACDYYAEQVAAMLADEPRRTDAARSYVRFDAIGPVLAIMPWNFPFWQVFRFAAPALAAGNAGILKHAPNVSRCALEIEQLLREAGFPEGLFRAVFL